MHLPYDYIVPGGRFREIYNWDSLWIIKGLLQCDMIDTAIGMARNLLHLVSTLHFVPNGNRVYYSVNFGRSQPPVLTRIILEIAQFLPALNATAFIAEAFHVCQLEHSWWLQTAGDRPHALYVSTDEETEEMFLLSRYASDQTSPRPESWSEDLATIAAAGFTDSGSEGAKNLFGELAASAESGYDFSSRFFSNGASLATCDTSQVIPVDLQALLLVMEYDLSVMAKMLAEASSSSATHCVSSASSSSLNASSINVSPYSSPKPKKSMSGAIQGLGSETLYCRRNPNKPICIRDYSLSNPIQERAISSSVAAADRIDDWLSEALKTGGTVSFTNNNVCACELHSAFTTDGDRYNLLAISRSAAMDSLMWSDDDNQWRDLRIVNTSKGGKYVIANRPSKDSSPYASNWIPLWAYSIAKPLNNISRSRAAAQSLAESGLVDAGGVLVSLKDSGQQWDWPNAFAPLQSFLYDGLVGTTLPDDVLARDLASTILHRWVKSALNNFLRDGILNEKNDGRVDTGISGRGGEYTPQTGFGWSIGVALEFLIHLTNDTENPRNSKGAYRHMYNETN